MNIIIRSYHSQNLHGFTGMQMRGQSGMSFPENVSNNQFARYLYYVGHTKAVQLEYSEAQSCLIQSLRKGPERGALGFRLTV